MASLLDLPKRLFQSGSQAVNPILQRLQLNTQQTFNPTTLRSMGQNVINPVRQAVSSVVNYQPSFKPITQPQQNLFPKVSNPLTNLYNVGKMQIGANARNFWNETAANQAFNKFQTMKAPNLAAKTAIGLENVSEIPRRVFTGTKISLLNPTEKKQLANAAINMGGFSNGIGVAGKGLPLNKTQISYLKSLPQDARSALGKFAQMVEGSSSANKKNMGWIGDYAQTVAEEIYGKDKVSNLTNKQLKNLIDASLEAADKYKGKFAFTAGLSSKDIRGGVGKDFKLTNKGLIKPGEIEIPGIGITKAKPAIKEITKDEALENLTTAAMQEDDPRLFKDTFTKWIGQRNAAKTTGAVSGYKYTDIPINKGMEFIEHAEGTTKSTDPLIVNKANQWKQDTDILYKDIQGIAKEVGIDDLGFVKRYVTHYWKETPQQVQQKLLTASRSNKSLRERGIMTYKEGINLGLTPKYSNPSQIMSEYVRKLEQTKSNLELFKDLKDKGLLVSASEGRGVAGFEPINAIGFPKSTTTMNGKTIEGAYYAPSTVARQINKIFSPEEGNRILSNVAGVTRKFQDITLSGGLPKTPINAFSVAQAQKELLAGRIKSPIRAFTTALSDQKSKQFFVDNSKQIKKMQLRDINVTTNLNTDDLVKSLPDDLRGKLGTVWDRTMSDPTFKRFMPMLQVNLFNDIEKQALKGGRSSEEAADIAAKAVSNFYGSISAAKEITTSPNTRNTLTSVFFAPKFRESMINFWVNNVKALRRPLALENRNNLKFLAGAAITYGVMNQLNQSLSGHGMNENPEGKKDKLLIPLKDGYTLGIPFLSSIATVPRGVLRIAGSTAKGDYAAASKDAGQTFLSSTLKPAVDVMSNEDYFGKQIYDPDATTQEKQLAVAKYIGKQFLGHPWIKSLIDSKSQPAYQTVSKALELPFRFYKSESIANAPFWEEYNKVKTIGQKYNETYDKELKAKYYEQNKKSIDQYDFMKDRVKAYYADNKNSAFLQSGTAVGNNVVVADGRIVELDKFDVQAPKLTGQPNLDKEIISAYKGEITKRKNDVEAMYKAGLLTAEQAESMLTELTNRSSKVGGGKASKKIVVKSTAFKIPLVKTKKATNIKIKLPSKPKIAKDTTGFKITTSNLDKPIAIKKPTIKFT